MSRRNADTGRQGGAATSGAMFGELLRDLREAAGLSQLQVANAVPCDRSFVAHVELGRRVPDRHFVEACDEILKTNGMLTRLWGRVDWYPVVEHPDWFKRRAAMDEIAVALMEYQTQMVPGLLQTKEYTHRLFARSAKKGEKEHLVSDRVEARMARQRRFRDPDGPMLVAVLDESCIRRVVGDAGVMRRQCAHLLEFGEQPNVRIQIAPFGPRELRLPDVSMSLITLPDGHRWLYSESLTRGHFIEDPEVVAERAQVYDLLRADALSAADSAALIRLVMEEEYGDYEQG